MSKAIHAGIVRGKAWLAVGLGGVWIWGILRTNTCRGEYDDGHKEGGERATAGEFAEIAWHWHLLGGTCAADGR